MAYHQDVADRIQEIIDQWPNSEAKKMFGGVCYLQNGNMVCGVHGDSLILRLGPDGAGEALLAPHVTPFDITGRPMKGWVMVGPDGFRDRTTLEDWLAKARSFVSTLPSK